MSKIRVGDILIDKYGIKVKVLDISETMVLIEKGNTSPIDQWGYKEALKQRFYKEREERETTGQPKSKW